MTEVTLAVHGLLSLVTSGDETLGELRHETAGMLATVPLRPLYHRQTSFVNLALLVLRAMRPQAPNFVEMPECASTLGGYVAPLDTVVLFRRDSSDDLEIASTILHESSHAVSHPLRLARPFCVWPVEHERRALSEFLVHRDQRKVWSDYSLATQQEEITCAVSTGTLCCRLGMLPWAGSAHYSVWMVRASLLPLANLRTAIEDSHKTVSFLLNE
jgi:hypothetical protein